MRTALTILFSFFLVAPARALDLTSCGQVVPPKMLGILQTDLSSCATAVTVSDHATLELNGHSISGSRLAVACTGKRCTVFGPGTITGGHDGIQQTLPTRGRPTVIVQDVDIQGPDDGGIVSVDGILVLTRVSVKGAGNTVPDRGLAITSFKLTATDLTVTDNPGYGVYVSRSPRITNLTATGNGSYGLYVQAGTAMLVNSVLTGNDAAGGGIDLFTTRRPHLITTTCGHSGGNGSTTGPSWHACSGDLPRRSADGASGVAHRSR